MKNAFSYYEKTKNSNIPENLRMFMNMKVEPGICIDLGCGAGRDSKFLIKNGWKVIAIDKEDTEKMIRSSLQEEEQNYLEFIKQDFENNIILQSCNLLVANSSLSFCNRKNFDDLLEAAGKNVKCDIPEAMIRDEVTRMLNQYEEHLKMQGLTLKQFYQFTQSNEDALRDQMKEEATKRVLYRLMLEEIVKAENIEATKDEIKEEADKMSKRYNMTKEEFIKAFGGEEMVKYDIEMRKAIEVLKEAK